VALLENRIHAFNREGTIHELSEETLRTLDALPGISGLTSNPDGSDPKELAPPDDQTLRAAFDEIMLVQGSLAILRSRPSPDTLDEVRGWLPSAP
jgi:hypothetical protein